MFYTSKLTGKRYAIAVVARTYEDPNTGLVSPYWREVAGFVDGEEILLDRPVWFQDVDRAISLNGGMVHAIIRYLEGDNHISHYKKFPEIVQALEAVSQ